MKVAWIAGAVAVLVVAVAVCITQRWKATRLLSEAYSKIDPSREKKEGLLREKTVAAAADFIARNKLPFDPAISTNRIARLETFLFTDGRPGGMSNLRLTDNCWFDCRWDGKALEVHAFNDSNVNTYYDLSGAPKEKIEAIKTLNLRNKLNEHTALELARTYFRLQGHKEENFWPVEFTQCYWIDQTERKPEERVLPFYRAEWFRKDIRKEDRESGVAALPHVNIELSGITSNLVLYEKLFIPIARDF